MNSTSSVFTEERDDVAKMAQACDQAAHARLIAPPNPWVGAVLVTPQGTTFVGYTQRPGHAHAEPMALRRAGEAARGSTLYVTLEPCSHHGRTPPCADEIITAGVARVVVGIADPDPRVSGSGIDRLREAGIRVDVGVGSQMVREQLAPYIRQRTTGRPYVVVKAAASIDGRTAAPDGTSQWITGAQARADVHRLRAESDAILVGAGTAAVDNPRLTVRGVVASDGEEPRTPLRVVLGRAPDGAAMKPCLEVTGPLDEILDDLGSRDVVQLLVEGGANTAAQFHKAGLVDRYVMYLAPMFMGGGDGSPIFSGLGATTLSEAFRGTLDNVHQLGDDVRLDILPTDTTDEG